MKLEETKAKRLHFESHFEKASKFLDKKIEDVEMYHVILGSSSDKKRYQQLSDMMKDSKYLNSQEQYNESMRIYEHKGKKFIYKYVFDGIGTFFE